MSQIPYFAQNDMALHGMHAEPTPTFVIFISACKKSDSPAQKTNGVAWQKFLGGSGEESNCYVAKASDGGILLAGTTNSTDVDASGNHGGKDILVVKLDASGNKQWSKFFGGPSTDYAMGIVAVADGGCAVVGYTNSVNGDITGNHGLQDALVIKLDASGNKQWVKTFGGTNNDLGYSIVTTTDGGNVLAGVSQSSNGDVSVNKGSGDQLSG